MAQSSTAHCTVPWSLPYAGIYGRTSPSALSTRDRSLSTIPECPPGHRQRQGCARITCTGCWWGHNRNEYFVGGGTSVSSEIAESGAPPGELTCHVRHVGWYTFTVSTIDYGTLRQAIRGMRNTLACGINGLYTPSRSLDVWFTLEPRNSPQNRISSFFFHVAPADLCQGPKKIRDPGFAESKVWDLDRSWTLHVLFVVGLWKPRTSKLWYAARPWKPRTSKFWPQWDPGNPGPQSFDSRKTLEIQDLKFWICVETLETRTQNLKIFMSWDF